MYAIIKTGGKQYRVAEGQVLNIEKISAPDADQTVRFDNVLMVARGEEIQVGAPYLKDAHVTAEIVDQGRLDKINIIKFKRRKHHLKHQGHRQYYTQIKVKEIRVG